MFSLVLNCFSCGKVEVVGEELLLLPLESQKPCDTCPACWWEGSQLHVECM